jgi:hypothetical protein
MIKKLLKNLLLTFILSLLLTGFSFFIWFHATARGFEEGQALTILFFVGDIFQNIILTIATLPVLLLSIEDVFNNKSTRLVFYFGGPTLLTICFVLFVGNDSFDKIGFLLPGLSFIIIHSCFYYKMVRYKQSLPLKSQE